MPLSASPIDLRPGYLALVRSILRAFLPDREVWAFGSRVTGTAKETSDLDLAVIGSTPLDPLLLAHVRDAFSESSLPMKVDIVDWATTRAAFRRIIAAHNIVLQPSRLRKP